MDSRSGVMSIEGEKAVVEEQSGRAIEQQGAEAKKGCGSSSSSDVLRELETHVVKMEIVVGDVQGMVEELSESIKGVEFRKGELKVEVQELKSGMVELRGEMLGTLTNTTDELQQRNDALEALVEVMHVEMAELKVKLTKVEAATMNRVISVQSGPQVDVPKPKEFKGSWVAEDVDNFLWYMEQYFRAMGLTDSAQRVTIASMYLTDDALLWWRCRCDDRFGQPIMTWEMFVKEFRRQYYPTYAEEKARDELRRLEQRGQVREYVNKFSELLLQIPSMNDTEAYFQFIGGLKPWVKQELKRCDAKDLYTAMSMAETLVEYNTTSRNKSDSRLRGKVTGGDRNKFHCQSGSKASVASTKAKAESSGGVHEMGRFSFKCFLCYGAHMARDCPTQGKFAALVKAREEEQEEMQLVRCGSLV